MIQLCDVAWGVPPAPESSRSTIWNATPLTWRRSSSAVFPNENEFIATQVVARLHFLQLKPASPIEVEDLLRLCHLKWIAAHPVHHVAPHRHSAGLRILAEGSGKMQRQRILEQTPPIHLDKRSPQDWWPQESWRSIISALHPVPASAQASLVVVNRDEHLGAFLRREFGIFER